MTIKRYKDMTRWERRERLWVIVSIAAYGLLMVMAAVLSQVN